MKKLILVLVVLTFGGFKTAESPLTEKERAFIITELNRTKENLLKSLQGLSDTQLNFKSTPTSWSIAECAEHLAVSENNLWNMIDKALKQPANPSRRAEIMLTDEDVLKQITDRTSKVKTNEISEPVGRYGSFDGAVNEFKSKRDVHIDYIKTTQEDLRNRYRQLRLGMLDIYQVVLFMSGHTERHTAQIEEVKANPNFPKK